MSGTDQQRRLDAEDMRRIREERLETRKRAAFRVLDSGGTAEEAARAAGADCRTVIKWKKERKG